MVETSPRRASDASEPRPGGAVYKAFAAHQIRETWDCHKVLTELQRWSEIFHFEFNLEIPELSLCVDWLPRRRLGQFRYGYNGFGLRGQIAINRRYLGRREFWRHLGTLLHEMIHAWQQAHGKPGKGNFHNKEFRRKAQGCGLVIDHRGVTQHQGPSRFIDLLNCHGIIVPELSRIVLQNERGASKLKTW
jgi:hypothetical protein